MADQPMDQSSEAPMGGPPGGNPSAYGGMTRGPMNPSMAPTSAPPPRRGGMINTPKFAGVGMNDISGNKQLLKWILGEFLGTALLVFFGIGSVITASGGARYCYWSDTPADDGCSFGRPRDPSVYKRKSFVYFFRFHDGPGSGTSTLHVSFGFGMAVACIAQAIGHVSGCHLNPAVSFGLVAAGGCSIMKALIYTGAQIFGAVFGAGLLKLLTWKIISGVLYENAKNPSDSYGWHLGVSTLGGANLYTGIAIECWLTFILVLVVCGVCDGGRKDITGSAPLAIGFAVFLCHVVGIHLTGSSVNPARSIGPVPFVSKEVVPDIYKDLVVYIVGPMLGGVLAGGTYNIFFRAPEQASAQVAPETQQRQP